jgi:hypothetical protein
MKRFILSIALSCLILSNEAVADGYDTNAKKATYRSAIKELGSALKSELMAAMKAGGPVKALGVCHTKAFEISTKVSEKVGLNITRTSLKPRNANNAPAPWEELVLKQFEERRAAGENPKTLESFEMIEKDGQRQIRYMKAIRTAAPCLACHGSEIEPDIQNKLKELYPEDKATGFKAGDLRGAFSITETLP